MSRILTSGGVASLLVAAALAGPATAAHSQPRIAAELSAGAPVSMKVSTHSVLAITEASDGAVFYAPQPTIGEKGKLRHTVAARVVRVVDGTKPAAIAEHAPGPVLALDVSKTTLYVATNREVVSYSRKTGKALRHWKLPTKSTYVDLALGSHWLYVDSAFECDFCGYEPTKLVSINLRSQSKSGHTVATKVFPGTLAAREGHVYYGLQTGHLVETTPTARKNHYSTKSPYVGLSVVGYVNGKLVSWGLNKAGNSAAVWVLDPATLAILHTRGIPAESAYDVVASTLGPILSDSSCPRQLPPSLCHSANIGRLGTEVSQLDLGSGETTDPVAIGHIDFVLGPKATAVTASGGLYHLVRISESTPG